MQTPLPRQITQDQCLRFHQFVFLVDDPIECFWDSDLRSSHLDTLSTDELEIRGERLRQV